MKTKSIMIAAVAVLALVISACGPTTINQEAPVNVRTLSVSGTGQANLEPDIAYIYVGAHAETTSTRTATTARNMCSDFFIILSSPLKRF